MPAQGPHDAHRCPQMPTNAHTISPPNAHRCPHNAQAGLPRESLLETDTAVFVGVMSIEFREVLPHTNAYAMTGIGHCFAAGRLSYVLGLHGACEAIDVACSAALVACHSAHRALQMHDGRDALLAGVNMCVDHASILRTHTQRVI